MRICKTLLLKNDDQLIKEYKAHHAKGNAWPEITVGIKAIGIRDMEIYISGNCLFMIIDVPDDFDHDRAFAELANLPRQKEWELLMSTYQLSVAENAGDKWQTIERIYSLADQQYS